MLATKKGNAGVDVAANEKTGLARCVAVAFRCRQAGSAD